MKPLGIRVVVQACGLDGIITRSQCGGIRKAAFLMLLSFSATLSAQSVSFTEYAVPTVNSQPYAITMGPDGALWFTEDAVGKIGRITTAGVFTEYSTSNAKSYPIAITMGPDGALWFTGFNEIGRITTGGVLTEYPLPSSGSGVFGLTEGPDGALWFAEESASKIGRITTAGVIAEYPTPSPGSYPIEITVGADGALWFAEEAGKIGRITTGGAITEYSAGGAQPQSIAAGLDGALWFTGFASAIGRITTAGVVTQYPVPVSVGQPDAITVGPDGALWFSVDPGSSIGRITTAGVIDLYPVPVSTAGSGPNGITEGPDGALWLPETNTNHILRAAPTAVSGQAGITVSPAKLSFSIAQGGSSSQQISLTSDAGVPWSASASAGWVLLSPTSGTAPGAITVAIDTASLQPGAYTTSITISNPGASPSQETVPVSLTVSAATPPGNSQCANIGGTWNVSETGSANFSIVSPLESDSFANPIAGSGSVTITQTGCSFQYVPIAEDGLIGDNLTASQLAAVTRTGTVSGNNVSFTGIVALVNTVESTQAGVTITEVSKNLITGEGEVADNAMTLNGTGNLEASGTYSLSGQTGSLTLTITTSSTAIFTRSGYTPSGTITSVAGTGSVYCYGDCAGFSGDGGPATLAQLNGPEGVAVDALGDIFIADSYNARIRKVAPSGTITTVAGNGAQSFSGDGGPATSASLHLPTGVAVDSSGNLFIADRFNYRVRKVSADGSITTVAGNGAIGFSGDGGPATSALLGLPSDVAVDRSGNLFIADIVSNRIRKVSAQGIITTVAGNGDQGFSGDGGPATSASLSGPSRVVVDAVGNLFIADSGNNRIRKVSTNGIITTVAGNGTPGSSGNDGPATSAELNDPTGLAVDASGDLFIANLNEGVIQEVWASGIITTVAGGGGSAGNDGYGDGGPATSASLSSPEGLALDASGDLFIADEGDNRIRKVSGTPEVSESVEVTSVGNGASFAQSFAPGMLMSVFGTGLSAGSPQTVTTAPLPLISSSGTSVAINGIPAPLLYISATQINLQIPYEVSPGTATLIVNSGGQSASLSFTIQAAAPGIFVDSKTNHMVPNESAGAGSTIGFFLTGAGRVTPAEATGNVPAQGTTPVPNLPLTLTVGGIAVTPVYMGIPGWSVGVLQINFTVPSTLAAGTYPVVVTIGGVASQAALLTVTAPS